MAEAANASDEPREGGPASVLEANKEALRFNYGIIVQSDIPEEEKQKEMMDLCQIACEKFAAAEKTPLERDNQAAAEMIKV